VVFATTAFSAESADSPLPHYRAQPVPFPAGAPYVLADGSIYIAGNDLITPVMEKLNRVFVASHPEFKFTLDLHASAMAVSGVTSGKSALGPMGRDASFRDKDAFASRYGYPITDVQIGWDNNPSPDRFPGGKNPPGIWVNVKNPLPALTLKEVRSILTTGSEGGDITFWRQIVGDESAIGLNGGDWSKRMIHVYLPALRGLPILATTRMIWGGNPWTRRAEFLPRAEDVLNAVANDPFGIGFIGWWPDDMGWDRQAELGAQVRLLPLEDDEGHVSRGRMGDRYPLAGGLRIMVNREPKKPLEPWIKEYLTLALSQEGQDIVASTTQSDGFLPLDRDDVARELAKLQ
jgi:phosphate transport system substrate-binding protein